jgi:hypothetical protein
MTLSAMNYLLFKFVVISCTVFYLQIVLYTSQQKKRYKGLMLNIFLHREKKSTKIVFRFIWAYIASKAISTTFLNIIIRTNHGQTEIVMKYGGLVSSVTCVTTSCSNDSFASPMHRTNQSLDKGLSDVVPIVHKCVTHYYVWHKPSLKWHTVFVQIPTFVFCFFVFVCFGVFFFDFG